MKHRKWQDRAVIYVASWPYLGANLVLPYLTEPLWIKVVGGLGCATAVSFAGLIVLDFQRGRRRRRRQQALNVAISQ